MKRIKNQIKIGLIKFLHNYLNASKFFILSVFWSVEILAKQSFINKLDVTTFVDRWSVLRCDNYILL